jgi:hypothetical protein
LSHILYTLVYYDTNISKSAEEEEEGPFHESAVISEEEDAPNSDIDFHEEDANATTFYATTDGVIVTDTSRTAAADLITTSFRDFHIVAQGILRPLPFAEFVEPLLEIIMPWICLYVMEVSW